MSDCLAETSVPVLPAVAGRWSPSRFHPERAPTREELLALLEAARWAPSSGNEQPWRFLVVPRGHPRREAVEAALTPGNAWAKRAPVLLVTAAAEARAKNGAPNGWAEHDLGIATGFLLVQAAALGVATHPMGGWSPDALRAAVALPDGFHPMAVIAVGHHDPELRDEALETREARPRERRPLGEVAFLGGFGEEPAG
ncbi:MAG TPA: nitroreductase family protein [Longimicrobiaceae bacterium]